MKIFKSRVFRQGSIATFITILGIALIIVMYVVLSTLSTRLNWRVDLTADRIFEITQESIDFLAALDKDVNIFVLNSEDSFVNAAHPFTFQANEVIRRYDTFGPRVNLEYIDIFRNPMFTASYPEIDLMPNQILIESPETGRFKIVTFRDLFDIATGQGGQTTIRASRAEQVMTSAILNVSSDNQVIVSVLSGYNQTNIPAFLNLLEMNNYEIYHEDLVTTAEINTEATIALLVAPSRDISEEDLKKLDRFLNNNNEYGRTVFYINSAHETPMSQMPNLSAWLAEWGIKIKDSVLFETDIGYRIMANDPFVGFTDYSDNEVSLELSQFVRARDLRAVSFYSSPLSVLFDGRGSISVNPLLQTPESSGILPGDGEITEESLTGPHPMTILSTMTRYQGTTMMASHVLVSGSLASFSEVVLGEVNFANSEYFLNLMNILAVREDTVRIKDKSFSISTIQITMAQARLIIILVMIVLPVGVLVYGIVVWLRRRHR